MQILAFIFKNTSQLGRITTGFWFIYIKIASTRFVFAEDTSLASRIGRVSAFPKRPSSIAFKVELWK